MAALTHTDYGGFQGRVLVGKETTYGTEVTGNKTIGLLQGTIKLDETNNLVEKSGVGHRNTQHILTGRYGITGSFDYIVQEGSFPYFTLGSYDATSPVADTPYAGVYKHIINSNDTTVMDSFSLNLGIDSGTDKQKEVAGCKVSSQSFNFDLDNPLTSTVQFTGKTIDISGSTAPSVTEHAEVPYMCHSPGTVIDTGTDSCKAKVTAGDVTITNTLKPVYAASSRLLTDLLCTRRTIAGNLTMNFEDDTEYEKFLSDAASPTAPKATDGVKEFDTTITFANEASGSETVAYRGFTLELADCKFNTHGFSLPAEDALTDTFGFIAETCSVYYYDVTATDEFA